MTTRIPFLETATQIGKATDDKHVAYGRALEVVPQILALLLRDTPPERLKDVQFLSDLQAMTRVLEKFCRLCGPDPEAYGENPWIDAAGYAVGRAHLLKLEQEAATPEGRSTDDESPRLPTEANKQHLREALGVVYPGTTSDMLFQLLALGVRRD